ncbi:MAG: hypothetical protein IKN09_04905 [Clostridia bacterium]|nr:hypothetical protein [Clostridia bacterium]MBR4261037.1 hypothetical protein [Clostridia bacterium]
MDDVRVIPVVQELQKKKPLDIRALLRGDKPDNDGIEGDAEFNTYHDDHDWCE